MVGRSSFWFMPLLTGETEKVSGVGCFFFVLAFWQFTYRVAVGCVGKIPQITQISRFLLVFMGG